MALGGTNTIDNIQPLCRRCNSLKHLKTIDFAKNPEMKLTGDPNIATLAGDDSEQKRRARTAPILDDYPIPVTVRVPRKKCDKFAKLAKRQGLTLNAAINVYISNSMQQDTILLSS